MSKHNGYSGLIRNRPDYGEDGGSVSDRLLTIHEEDEMDNEKVAEELVKIAKDLAGFDKVSYISDYDDSLVGIYKIRTKLSEFIKWADKRRLPRSHPARKHISKAFSEINKISDTLDD